MTNEEKAKLISEQFHCDDVAYDAAEQMAEWKEQQMIDKACEWLKNNIVSSSNDTCIYTASSHNISKEDFIVNFKKAMEEQL